MERFGVLDPGDALAPDKIKTKVYGMLNMKQKEQEKEEEHIRRLILSKAVRDLSQYLRKCSTNAGQRQHDSVSSSFQTSMIVIPASGVCAASSWTPAQCTPQQLMLFPTLGLGPQVCGRAFLTHSYLGLARGLMMGVT